MVPLDTSVHSREPKTRAAEVYRYFVSKIFVNHNIINDSQLNVRHIILLCATMHKQGVINVHIQAIFQATFTPRALGTFCVRHNDDTTCIEVWDLVCGDNIPERVRVF